ncbi:hypothetical protein [Thermococcus barophilus]|uniref:Uncharacterized protein n=1 Tax=Thermococcus barophilus (strain DSM 11836 / MP) TaxID=391623 RepID=F0LMV5_THEBM|nr:hypothetical protein [Thermococcus barophilus]ADT84084.1 hypothetical protein TERMP_01108 [Thermococcus barophilus MP]
MEDDEKGLYVFFLIAGILMQLGVASMFYEFDYATNIKLGISVLEFFWPFFEASIVLSILTSLPALISRNKMSIIRAFALTQFLFIPLYFLIIMIDSILFFPRRGSLSLVNFLVGSLAFLFVNYGKIEKKKLTFGVFLSGIVYAALIYFAMFHGIGK